MPTRREGGNKYLGIEALPEEEEEKDKTAAREIAAILKHTTYTIAGA